MSPAKKSHKTFLEVVSETGWGRGNSSDHLKPKDGQRKILGATVPKRENPEDELTEQDKKMFASLFDPETLKEPGRQ